MTPESAARLRELMNQERWSINDLNEQANLLREFYLAATEFMENSVMSTGSTRNEMFCGAALLVGKGVLETPESTSE